MGRRKVERTVMVTFRLTESERIRLDELMACEGYRSVSLFLRDRAFRTAGRKAAGAAGAVTGQASAFDATLVAHVRKIGVNVNTACRNINASAARNSEGRLDKSMEYWLRKVSSYLYRIS